MRWYELCDNPDAVASKYNDPSALAKLVIRELFVYDSPFSQDSSLRVFGDLTRPPDHCGQSDVARLGLALWNVVDLALAGSPAKTTADVGLSRLADGHLRFELTASEFRLSAQCKQAMIESFDVFSEEYVRRNVQTLRSYQNVWNSCLLVLRTEGFDLELCGNPDPRGGPSHCTWYARRDGFELKGTNPVELLGLTDLARRAKPQPPPEYWWRQDGPDIVSEVYEAWRKKQFGPYAE